MEETSGNFRLSSDAADALLDLIGLADLDARASATVHLTDIAVHYMRWAQGPPGVTRAVSRKSLRAVEHATEQLLDALSALPADAEFELGILVAGRLDEPSGVHALDRVREELRDLGRNIAHVHRGFSAGSDRLPNRDLAWAIRELIRTWETYSGRAFTLSTGEMNEPISPAGKFVCKFFELVGNRVRPSTLTTELKRLSKYRKKASIEPNPVKGI